jgi:hypothetical protein
MLACAIFLLTACHGYTPPHYEPALYPHTYKHYDLTLFWKTEKKDNAYNITGFVKNTRYPYVKDLELTASLRDEGDKSLAEATFFFFPNLLPMDELAPFTLDLPVKPGNRPIKIKFFYRYRLAERDYDTSPYFYSFETELY